VIITGPQESRREKGMTEGVSQRQHDNSANSASQKAIQNMSFGDPFAGRMRIASNIGTCLHTQVSHGLEKTLANLPFPRVVTSFRIHGTHG
jgi:hypothetical protein